MSTEGGICKAYTTDSTSNPVEILHSHCPKCMAPLISKLGDFSGGTKTEMSLELRCPNCDFPLTLRIYDCNGKFKGFSVDIDPQPRTGIIHPDAQLEI